MELLVIFIFIFTCYGISNTVIYSNGPFDVFLKWRGLTQRIHENLGDLFSCMMCFPVWVGLIISAINLFLLPSIPMTPMNMLPYLFGGLYAAEIPWLFNTLIILFDGAISSGTTWLIHNIEEYFEKN